MDIKIYEKYMGWLNGYKKIYEKNSLMVGWTGNNRGMVGWI